MKHLCQKFFCLILLFVVAILTGCEQLTLENGKYETSLSGRDDFAAVYKDLIFIRVREPSEDPARNSYWDWAGKFEIESDGHILLKMDKDLAREWKFHYNFYRRDGGMITVYDLGSENSYNLRLRPASGNIPSNGSSQTQGGFPVYR